MKKPRALLAALLAGLALVQAAHAAPDTVTQQVTYGGQTITMRLTKQNLRGSHFQLRAQNVTGAYDTITPVDERSYLGTVDGYPDAVASGIIKDNGVFRGAVYFDRGATWFTTGGSVDYTRGTSQPASFGFPGSTPSPGEAGNKMYGFEVGIDADYDYYSVRSAGSVAKALENIEFSVAVTRAMYMTNLLVRPYLSRVIIRTSQAMDPANGKQGGTYLDAVRTEWNNNQTDAVRQVVAGVTTSDVGGGLAWVGVIGTSSAYSVSDSGGDGQFSVIWRHELGHNWGLGHYDGGTPEGSTINSSNQYARMSGPELDKALNHRNGRLNKFTDEGTYTAVDLPPYAAIDSATLANGSNGEIVLDVLANDHDANGHALSLLSSDSTSYRGGKIARQGNKLIYYPLGNFLGSDSFTYKVQDSSGQTATGAVAVNVTPNDRLRLYLALDESAGTSAADQSVFNRDGTLEGTDFAASTVAGKFGQAVTFDGVDDSVYSSGVSLKSNTVTLCGWIKREATQVNYAGIIFDRSSTVSGINIGSDGKLRYHWNDSYYGWNSNLTPPVGVWTFVALVVEPNKATMYMNSGSGFTSAVNTASHGSATFGTVHVGKDPSNSRNFTGAIDDARVYAAALSPADLQKVADGGAAESPNPFDGARNVAAVDLKWAQAPGAVKYHVYLGTSQSAVAAATIASPEYLGERTASVVSSPALSPSVTYWWRVDVETATATIPGPVWTFTRNSQANPVIANHSFEDGATAGTPSGWSLVAGNPSNVGVAAGGSEGAKYLYIGPSVTLDQILAHTLTSGETLTLTYQSSRTYTRRIQLLSKSGSTYTLLAETIEATGSSSWPTITLNHTVAAAQAGKQLVLRIISTNWNEFDNFHLSSALPGPANSAPAFTADPLALPAAAALANYTGQSLAPHVTDADGGALVFSKISGPSWLQVAADGTLSGTPGTANAGNNAFIVRVMDSSGGRDYADLTIPVGSSQFHYDLNGATAGSGAAGGGTWDGSAQWTSSANGTAATFGWSDGATVAFSAGADAAGDYTITNSVARIIGGFIARSGKPKITGGSLQLNAAGILFQMGDTPAEIVSPITGGGGMVKNGPGTLVLGGNNTFTGNIAITGGTLELTATGKLYNGAYQHNAIITIGADATWRVPNYSYTGVGQLSDFAARRVIDGGLIEVTGNTHSSGQDFTVTDNGGTFRYTPAGQTLTLVGNNNTNIAANGPLTFDTTGNITVVGTSAIIGGSGSIVKTGAGILTLGNGENSFGGPLHIEEGKLVASAVGVGSNTTLGAKSGARFVTVDAAAEMEWTRNDILGAAGQSAANLPTIVLNGGAFKTTRYNLVGHLILDGASLINSNATDPVTYDGFQFLGTITANGPATSSILTTTARGNHLFGGGTTDFAVTDPAGLLTVATILRDGSTGYPGTASLRKTGSGTLALTTANAYTGTTTVEGGTLELTGSLNSASATTVAVGGKLSGTGSAAAVTVQAGGTLAPTPAANLNTGALVFATGSTFTADGRVSVTGDLDIANATLATTIPGPRVLASYTGIRSGTFTATVPSGWQVAYVDDAKEIRLEAVPADYSSWIAGYNTGGQSGFDQDANGDGIANGLVFLLGGDPTVAGSTALPVLAKTAGGFTYTFTRAARARGAATITARLSDDLATWPVERNIAIAPTTGSGVAIADQGDHDLITVTLPGTDPRTFVRLEVVVP